MEPRLVDERDSQWESEFADLRVFLFREPGFHEVFDLDQTTLGAAEDWAVKTIAGIGSYAIALRATDSLGNPGLIWLVDRRPSSSHLA